MNTVVNGSLRCRRLFFGLNRISVSIKLRTCLLHLLLYEAVSLSFFKTMLSDWIAMICFCVHIFFYHWLCLVRVVVAVFIEGHSLLSATNIELYVSLLSKLTNLLAYSTSSWWFNGSKAFLGFFCTARDRKLSTC